MNINSVNLINRPQKYSMTNAQNSNPKFSGAQNREKRNKAAVIGTIIGTGTALAMIAKRQGFSLNPLTIKKTPIKDWAIFKIANRKEPDRKLLELEEKEILALAGGSVIGGFTAGAIADRENIKAKGREALNQILGNVLIPVGFVGGTSKLYKRYEQQIKSAMPQFTETGKKHLEHANKFIRNLPAVGLTAAALYLGIKTGNKVTNYINEKLFGQKKERELKTSDFAPHVDDLSLAVTLMGSKNSPVTSCITRIVPLFLAIPGYQVGKAKENA